MAPSLTTEDFYTILEVEQSFQLLQRAYETLQDESKRREYDLVYPSIKRQTFPKTAHTSRPAPTAAARADIASEAAQIATLRKSKEERATRWKTRKNVYDSAIYELQRGIRRLQQEIKNLDSILAPEAAPEAQKNSWTTSLMSPLYKKPEESEEDKARKDREKQERRIERT
ncbi:hypothetical protein EK21DRAFT_91855 [Setomelanomma holmii]|uniref:J domain-containing protein n=1 Tax=Setomelanomma holmii TaxID=210430 RepID=A0A9P4H3U9_9PLEO|nr:hypothetical protein EK21DRAFT_91855 [Setomelanomma holmii]